MSADPHDCRKVARHGRVGAGGRHARCDRPAMSADTEPSPAAAPATVVNPWIPLTVVMGATIMVVLDSTIVNVALHQIGLDLDAGDGVEWIVTAYLLAVCVSQPAT